MCGVLAIFGKQIENFDQYISKLKNRGPEDCSVLTGDDYQIGFTRLAINGTHDGMQPFQENGLIWMCNGEIYNYMVIAETLHIDLETGSDCEVIGSLYKNSDAPFGYLDGVFSAIIIDGDVATIARDPYGVRPLFMSISKSRVMFSSELKALPYDPAAVVSAFPPGHSAKLNLKTLKLEMTKYHKIQVFHVIENYDTATFGIYDFLTNAVTKRLLADRPIAALLSGGLDSSLVAAILQLKMKTKLKTFSIGFEGSEDLRCARLVADHIKSDHTEIIMTPDDFFNAIPEVVRDVESFDITTIRASVGNWLVAREIRRRTDCKVIFNGDGSDELFGGYLYFKRSPSEQAFIEERDRLLDDIHYFDVLRSDRCISSHGLEPRTPFLDKTLVEFVKSVTPRLVHAEGKQEKWLLRKAFSNTGILPDEILYRKKEAFSDDVSSVGGLSWYRECQLRAEALCPNWKEESSNILYLIPKSAESFYYRKLFTQCYGDLGHAIVPYFWMPKWSPETTDPSARTLNPTAVDSREKDVSSTE
jgi:asparagine synthase (glutamine-hydrolysing)